MTETQKGFAKHAKNNGGKFVATPDGGGTISMRRGRIVVAPDGWCVITTKSGETRRERYVSEAVKSLQPKPVWPDDQPPTPPVRRAETSLSPTLTARLAAAKEKARETGKPVALWSWNQDCRDKEADCSIDLMTGYAMPDGTFKVEREHMH